MTRPPLVLVSLVTALAAAAGCHTAASKDDAAAAVKDGVAVVDEDAPAAEPWVARHARGTHVHLAGPRPKANLALADNDAIDAELVHYPSGDLSLLAVLVRPAATAQTGDTPDERLPAVLVIHGGTGLDDAAVAAAQPLVDAGVIVMLPSFRGENGNPGAPELYFGEVDDAKAAARFLAAEPDVDMDRLYAFGDGHVTSQLALDPDAPFRVVMPESLPDTAEYKKLGVTDADERIARAFKPHASEVKAKLLVTSDLQKVIAQVAQAPLALLWLSSPTAP